MPAELLEAARRAKGFMPEPEGLALHRAALATAGFAAPLLEIGSYCGKSAIYLGAAARAIGTIVYSVDHHRGSEEHQPGEQYHDPELVDPISGSFDTLSCFKRTIAAAGLADVVIGIVGDSATVGAHWATPLALVFVDGGHSAPAAHADYEGWARHVVPGGMLAIHDVFDDPAQGGRPPLEIYERAIASGAFALVGAEASLRLLQRVADG